MVRVVRREEFFAHFQNGDIRTGGIEGNTVGPTSGVPFTGLDILGRLSSLYLSLVAKSYNILDVLIIFDLM